MPRKNTVQGVRGLGPRLCPASYQQQDMLLCPCFTDEIDYEGRLMGSNVRGVLEAWTNSPSAPSHLLHQGGRREQKDLPDSELRQLI